MNKDKSVVGMWWIEQIIISNPNFVVATAMNPNDD
jgi:hypothetical protein